MYSGFLFVWYHGRMEDANELLDLFDEQENQLDIVLRSAYYQDPSKYPGYLRSAEMFIRNSRGQLWIPRRNMARKVAPGGLDYSCGGHVSSGEGYVQGCIREAAEELGLELAPKDLKAIFKTSPTPGSPWFRTLFLYESDEVPSYNKDDFSEYFWLTPQELLARLQSGEPAKQSMLVTLQAVSDTL
jgi:8-oxo-dGTP pyrophosphatase MutT (NUDIX family)